MDLLLINCDRFHWKYLHSSRRYKGEKTDSTPHTHTDARVYNMSARCLWHGI